MTNLGTTAIAVTALATLAACGPRETDPYATPSEQVVSDVPERLIRDRAEFLSAWQARDIDRSLAYFKDDAVVRLPDGETLRGSAQIRTWLGDVFRGMTQFRLDQSTFERDGNEVAERGRYTIMMQQPGEATMTERGSYGMEWEYEGARHLIQELAIEAD